MASSPPFIEVRGITKEYASETMRTLVLRGISFSVDRGEFVAVMGPSGSGKSTLMHILGFLDTPSAGQYQFAGQDVSMLTERALAFMRRTQVGFVFQAFFLLPHGTVFENVVLPLIYQGVPRREREDRARRAIASVGLSHLAAYRARRLSGGEKQRVAIARALIGNPAVLFADEPTGNLDSVSGGHVMELLARLNEIGHTIMLVTHETTTARFAKRVLHLHDGALVHDERIAQNSGSEIYSK